jgi:hypothetical protein
MMDNPVKLVERECQVPLGKPDHKVNEVMLERLELLVYQVSQARLETQVFQDPEA